MIVRPEIDAVTPRRPGTPGSVPPPLTVTPAVGPVIVSVPLVSLSSSWPPRQGDRLALAKTVGSKVIVSAPPSASARLTAWRRLRSPEGEAVRVDRGIDHQPGLNLEGADVGSRAEGKPRWSVVTPADRGAGADGRRCRGARAWSAVGPP